MTLDAVRARRQMLGLQKISDERIRRSARSTVKRVVATRGSVLRDDDDAAQGQPAVIVRLETSIYVGERYVYPELLTGEVLEKVIHKSGPVLIADSFGPADIGKDGSIQIAKLQQRESAPE